MQIPFRPRTMSLRPTGVAADLIRRAKEPAFPPSGPDRKFSLPVYFSPFSLIFLLAAGLAVVETVLLFAVPLMSQLTAPEAALAGAVAVAAALFPAVYLLLVRPMTVYVVRHANAEQHLRKSQVELIARLEERTKQLDSANNMVKLKIADLKKSESERLRLSREVEQRLEHFTQAINHEIATPMTAITGYAEILQRDLQKAGVNGRWLGDVNAIVRGALRLNVTVRHLVDSILLEAGELPVSTAPLFLHTIVPELKERLGPAFDPERIQISIPHGLPAIKADCSRLQTVLLNLISNALKFSPLEARIEVCAGLLGNEVIISVSDEGDGIGQQDLPHVFDRFARVGETRKAGGLGLGLYITKMLVEAQGGRIWAESELRKGSTFHVALPVS